MSLISKNGISVIICCYNSSILLNETLSHLAVQVVPFEISENWEIILVDNCSTDNTKDAAIILWNKLNSNIPLIIVEEFTPGQAFARKKGVKMAKYEYLIFCDDDNWLMPNYLKVAYEILSSNPDIGALGGQGIGVADIEFPYWWDDYKDGYAVGKQLDKSGFVKHRGYVWGAGIVLRKSLINKLFSENIPSLLSGRNGEKLNSGDDSEICYRILINKQSIYYDERLIFKHYMDSNRLTWEYKNRLFEGHIASHAVLSKYQDVLNSINKSLIVKIKFLIIGCLQLVFNYTGIKVFDREAILNQFYLDWNMKFIIVNPIYKKINELRKIN
jgi:glycosyltransferase involved in cell wall biosynthesis